MMYIVFKFNIKMEAFSYEGQTQTERKSSSMSQPSKLVSVTPTIKTFKPMQMDTNAKQLDHIMKEMDMIIVDSKNPNLKQTIEKKLQNYNKVNALSEEATQLLNKMEVDVGRINGSHISQIQSMKINDWVEMLTSGHLKITETVYIVEQLQAMLDNFSPETDIIDNVDREIIYEEQEIFDD